MNSGDQELSFDVHIVGVGALGKKLKSVTHTQTFSFINIDDALRMRPNASNVEQLMLRTSAF
jgi:hypothetical protein